MYFIIKVEIVGCSDRKVLRKKLDAFIDRFDYSVYYSIKPIGTTGVDYVEVNFKDQNFSEEQENKLKKRIEKLIERTLGHVWKLFTLCDCEGFATKSICWCKRCGTTKEEYKVAGERKYRYTEPHKSLY